VFLGAKSPPIASRAIFMGFSQGGGDYDRPARVGASRQTGANVADAAVFEL
jgi:hypothetical protein